MTNNTLLTETKRNKKTKNLILIFQTYLKDFLKTFSLVLVLKCRLIKFISFIFIY